MPRRTRSSTKDNASFGQHLATLRRLRGLTQVQLAGKLNSTQRAITYYENEASYPPVATIIQLSKILGVSTDELLGVKNGKASSDAVDLTSDPELCRLWKKFQQVAKWPEKDRNAVIRLINSVSEARAS